MKKLLKHAIITFFVLNLFATQSCIDGTDKKNNESIIRGAIYSIFLSDPLSADYIEYLGWKNILSKAKSLEIKKNNIKLELYEVDKSKKVDLPYKIVVVLQSDSSYIFPLNDWYYYSKIAGLSENIKDSICINELFDYYSNCLSFEKHINYIFDNFKSFSDVKISKQIRKENALLFTKNILNNFLSFEEIENEDDIRIALSNKSFKIKKDCLYFKFGNSIYELHTYFENDKIKVKYLLINVDSYKHRYFW